MNREDAGGHKLSHPLSKANSHSLPPIHLVLIRALRIKSEEILAMTAVLTVLAGMECINKYYLLSF